MRLEELYKKGFLEVDGKFLADFVSNHSDSYVIEEDYLTPDKRSTIYSRTLSKEYGLKAFPFHTDGAYRLVPPQWTILEYLSDEVSNTATLLFDSKIMSKNPDLEDLFFNEMYFIKHTSHSLLTPLINKQLTQEPVFRWNSLVMKKVFNKTNKTLDDCELSPFVRISWSKGKTIIIDNWRMLHSREKVVPGEEQIRKLKRYNLTPRIYYASI